MKVLRMDFSEAETVAQDGLFQHKGSGTLKLKCFGGNFRLARVFPSHWTERNFDMLGTILIVVLLLLLLGAWPAWPHSRSWGYYPSGTLGLVLVIVLVLALIGRI